MGGSWDIDGCTTVITSLDSTYCECSKFGSYAVLAELTHTPGYPEPWGWLRTVADVGRGVSIASLVIFVVGVAVRSEVRHDMFYLIRTHFSLCLMTGLVINVVMDHVDLTDRHLNLGLAALQVMDIAQSVSDT